MNGNRVVISLSRLVTLLAASVFSFYAFGANPGEMFPDLSKFDLEGKLPETKGKVVLVDFFASWCGPCRLSFPVMQELENRFKDKGFVVLAVSVDKKRADMDAFLKKLGTSFAVVRDASSKLVAEVKVSAMPTSFLLDQQGKIVAIHNGFRGEETKARYISEIEAILK